MSIILYHFLQIKRKKKEQKRQGTYPVFIIDYYFLESFFRFFSFFLLVFF